MCLLCLTCFSNIFPPPPYSPHPLCMFLKRVYSNVSSCVSRLNSTTFKVNEWFIRDIGIGRRKTQPRETTEEVSSSYHPYQRYSGFTKTRALKLPNNIPQFFTCPKFTRNLFHTLVFR